MQGMWKVKGGCLCLQVRQTSGEQCLLLRMLRNEKPLPERNFMTVWESSCPTALSISCTNKTSRKTVCALQDEMNNLIFFLYTQDRSYQLSEDAHQHFQNWYVSLTVLYYSSILIKLSQYKVAFIRYLASRTLQFTQFGIKFQMNARTDFLWKVSCASDTLRSE